MLACILSPPAPDSGPWREKLKQSSLEKAAGEAVISRNAYFLLEKRSARENKFGFFN